MTDTKFPSRVHIWTHRGSGDCEDCGFYDYAHFGIAIDGADVLQGNYDGHLGGGNWSGGLSQLYVWALQLLGYEVHVDGEAMELGPFYKKNEHHNWEPVALLPADFKVLNVTTQSVADPEAPDYPNITCVMLPPVAGEEPPVFKYDVPNADHSNCEQTWDGDWDRVLRALLASRCELTVEEHHEEPDDSDSGYGDMDSDDGV